MPTATVGAPGLEGPVRGVGGAAASLMQPGSMGGMPRPPFMPPPPMPPVGRGM